MALYPLYGFHGCSEKEAESILESLNLKSSGNPFEWLGHGFYLWENDPARALSWAKNKGKENPTVIGAIINSNQCLDLTSTDGKLLLKRAYDLLKNAYEQAGKKLPTNEAGRKSDRDEIKRLLDCAVMNVVFDNNDVPAVRCPFVEGEPIYPGGKFYEKTHTQICVRNPSCVLGVFAVRAIDEWMKILSPPFFSE